MLELSNLHVAVENKEVLKGVSLTIKPGEVHALMGPNGSGKSSLAYALMGKPEYQAQGSRLKAQGKKVQIKLDGKDILGLKSDERARLGLFLAFQTPVAVPGVSITNFLRQTTMKQGNNPPLRRAGPPLRRAGETMDIIQFKKILEQKCKELGISKEFLKRSLNDGFSGGEKKKMEMLQMMVLKPKYAIIDEIDTGLDVDALKIVAQAVRKLAQKGSGVLLITHYQRILKHLKPDFVHVIVGGKIVRSGKADLARKIERKGYKNLNF